MKKFKLIGIAATALGALPVTAQQADPMAESAPPATSANPADPVMDPAMPTTPANPTATPPILVQANPQGPGIPTDTPPNPESASDPVPPAVPADPSYQAGPYKGALTPPPAESMNKVYPLCTKKIQDSCRNRGGV